MSTLAGKVAIVTGASSGIGQVIAQELAAAGAKVVLNGRDRKRLEAVKQSITEAGGQAAIHVGDVRQEATHKELVELAVATYGALHIAVNNAGIYQFTPLADVTGAQVDDQVDVNIKGVIYGLKHQLPTIGRSSSADSWGSVINISTGATKRTSSAAQFGSIVYSITKAAVDHATYLGAGAGEQYHVRVNCVAPGPVSTPGVEQAMGVSDLAVIEKMASVATLLSRSGTTLEIAAAVIFLAGKSGAYINGVVLPVDGGMLVK